MIASGINLVMTVIGFAVSTMFILFVCTRLICARIQQSASRRRAFPAAGRTYHFSILERRNGLEPFVVANFPTKSFSDKLFSFEEDTQCTICLSEYQENDKLRMLPYCGHAFHITCIDIWLRQHSTCPVCRVSLHESPERKRIMNPQYSQPVRCPRSPRLFNSQSSDQQLCTDHHRLPLRPLEVIGTALIHQDHIEASNTGDSTICTSTVSDAKEAACFPEPEQNQVESH